MLTLMVHCYKIDSKTITVARMNCLVKIPISVTIIVNRQFVPIQEIPKAI